MAYKLIPGARQDHKGRFYQHARYPNGKGIIIDLPTPEKPAFTFRFLKGEGGHVWHFGAKVSVDSCGQSRCAVCSFDRPGAFSWYTVNYRKEEVQS